MLIGILAALAFAVALFYATVAETGVDCEVCVEFEGARACRSATAADRTAAIGSAVTTACAVLADGVTRSIRCDRTPPSSVRCSE